MSVNADDPTVSGSSGASAVNTGSATSGVTAEMKNELQRIVAGMFKDMVPRAVKAAVSEVVPQALQSALGEVLPKPTESQSAPAGGDNASSEKLSLKALQEQIAKLNQGIDAERRARIDAENKTREVRRISSVESAFAKHLGAESPHLKPYVAHYLAQFDERDGQLGRKVTGQYGDEQFVPLDEAVGELFKGDLKYLVQSSKAPNLPATGFGQARGQAYVPPTQAQGKAKGISPLMGEVLGAIAESRPEVAQQLAQSALNGTSTK